jgi:hypothetical protein
MFKKAFKSKTIWFAIALAVLSVWQGLLGSLSLSPVAQGVVGSIIAICVTVLRVITTMPLEDKE